MSSDDANSGGEPSEHGVRAKVTYAIRAGARQDIPTIKGADVQGADAPYLGTPYSGKNIEPRGSLHDADSRKHGETTQHTGKVRGKGEDRSEK